MSHHRRRIADHVHAERLVDRYTVEHEGSTLRLNERARLALTSVSRVFRTERGRDYLVAGDVAGELGDGQGWTAYPTVRALGDRGWLKGFQHYRLTDPGLVVLRELDRQWADRERCQACGGRVVADRDAFRLKRLPDDLCETCHGVGLVRRAHGDLRW